MKWYLFTPLLFLFSSCEKENNTVEINTIKYSGAKFLVRDFYLDSLDVLKDSLITIAKVTLYLDSVDAIDELNIQYSDSTGADGIVEFSALTKEKYQVLVKHTFLGTKNFEINTPFNTLSIEEVNY